MKSILLCSIQDIRFTGITFSHTFVSKYFMNNDAFDNFIFLMKLNGKHILQITWGIGEFRKSIL